MSVMIIILYSYAKTDTLKVSVIIWIMTYVSALSQLRVFTHGQFVQQHILNQFETDFKPPPRCGLQTSLEGDL